MREIWSQIDVEVAVHHRFEQTWHEKPLVAPPQMPVRYWSALQAWFEQSAQTAGCAVPWHGVTSSVVSDAVSAVIRRGGGHEVEMHGEFRSKKEYDLRERGAKRKKRERKKGGDGG